MLEIIDLHASIEGLPILKGFSLRIRPGEIHALMGPNGAGKSTLAKVLAGHPDYEITSGEILLEGKPIHELDPEERAQMGLFMSFQYPVEISGVTNEQFLYAAHSAQSKSRGQEPQTPEAFSSFLDEKMAAMGIKAEFKTRNLNEGFSGGEKKRNEILQMAVLSPKLAILDETDSGLDIDAMRQVAAGIQALHNDERALLLITHYQRLLDLIPPHFVHVVLDGKIALSGGPDLPMQLEEKGYDWLERNGS